MMIPWRKRTKKIWRVDGYKTDEPERGLASFWAEADTPLQAKVQAQRQGPDIEIVAVYRRTGHWVPGIREFVLPDDADILPPPQEEPGR